MDGKIKTRRWDIQEHLKTEEDMRRFLEACFEEAGDDPAFLAKAFGEIARARGMTALARETGLHRDTLYKALSGGGNPSFGTVVKVARALGFKMIPQPIA
ncbi:MAG: putative addiction module antidote protein [Candidatus Accumulibacter sp.]|jgi:probable addiction module antidote protein|nr:putative addiction module antidote protein [Accumulibacter sp.]